MLHDLITDRDFIGCSFSLPYRATKTSCEIGAEHSWYATKHSSPQLPRTSDLLTPRPHSDCNEEHPSREDLSRCTPLQKALIARRNEMGLYTTTDYMDNVVAGFRKDHEDANTEENEDMTAVGTPMTSKLKVTRTSDFFWLTGSVQLDDRASQSTGPEASALSDESALTNTLGGVQVFDESSSIQAEEDDTIIDDVDDAVSASDSTVLSSAASDRNESQQDDHIADLNAASGGPRDALSSAVTVATGTDLEENELDNMSDVDREQLPNLNGGGTPTAGGNKQSEYRQLVLRILAIANSHSCCTSHCRSRRSSSQCRLHSGSVAHSWWNHRDHENVACQTRKRHHQCVHHLHNSRSLQAILCQVPQWI